VLPAESPPAPPEEHPAAAVATHAEPPALTAAAPPAPEESHPPAAAAPEEPAPLPEPVAEAPPEPEPEPQPEVVAEHPPAEPAAPPEEQPAAAAAVEAAPDNKHWYVVKVQSGREESIKEAIERRVKIEGLEEFYGEIHIPMEKVTEVRGGKRYVKKRKLYPGYIMANVEYNDRILYLFRETSGVGDFVGGGINKPPQPMKPREVESMMGVQQEAKDAPIKHKFDRGDRVRVRDGTFTGMEGEIKEIVEAKNSVRVELTIFGRPVPVELEYWQVETLS
jgi:transcriptional antiterminator NusG